MKNDDDKKYKKERLSEKLNHEFIDLSQALMEALLGSICWDAMKPKDRVLRQQTRILSLSL